MDILYGDYFYPAIFFAMLIIPAFLAFFSGPVLRMFIVIADITIGLLTLRNPEWYIRDFGGKILPYYFDPAFDG